LRRARAYEKEVKLNKDDQMWLVIDTDRWPAKTLHRIAKYCQRKGWGIAISNPCFELWLYLHKEPLPVEVIYTSQEMKTALGELVVGGYTAENFVLLLAMAIVNAKAADDSVAYNLPELMRTQLWRLGEALLPFLED